MGPLPAWTRLGEIIETRLGMLDDTVRRSLGLLALGQPLEVQLLQAVDRETDLEALEHRGVVHIEHESRRLVASLHHPLYGDSSGARLSPCEQGRRPEASPAPSKRQGHAAGRMSFDWRPGVSTVAASSSPRSC